MEAGGAAAGLFMPAAGRFIGELTFAVFFGEASFGGWLFPAFFSSGFFFLGVALGSTSMAGCLDTFGAEAVPPSPSPLLAPVCSSSERVRTDSSTMAAD